MSTFADALTGGIIGGTIAAILIGLACLVGAIFFFVVARNEYDGGPMFFFSGLCAVGFIATVVVWVWASWPLSYDYHHWVDKTGTVERVSKRLVSDGDKGMYQKFVVVMNGQAYGIDDTRASLLREGSKVHLRCKKAYQFGVSRSAHGWDCRWAG